MTIRTFRRIRRGCGLLLFPGIIFAQSGEGTPSEHDACRVIRTIAGICTGTGVFDDLREHYARPTPLDDPHGTGAVLLAGTEILLLQKWINDQTAK